MIVLAIDTSNQPMTIAVMKEEQLLAEYTTDIKKNHSVQLMPAINQLLADCKMTPQDLDLIAVGHGPGSFTGVRIGLTTAKTLAWSLSIPIVAVSSLEVLSYNGIFFNGLVCPFFDARRGQVYTGLYQAEGFEKMVPVKDEVNVLMSDWLEVLRATEESVLFISSQASIHKEKIQEVLGEKAVFSSLPVHLPSAGMLASIALTKEPTSLHELTPNYLRLAEAEAKWLESQKGHQQSE